MQRETGPYWKTWIKLAPLPLVALLVGCRLLEHKDTRVQSASGRAACPVRRAGHIPDCHTLSHSDGYAYAHSHAYCNTDRNFDGHCHSHAYPYTYTHSHAYHDCYANRHTHGHPHADAYPYPDAPAPNARWRRPPGARADLDVSSHR